MRNLTKLFFVLLFVVNTAYASDTAEKIKATANHFMESRFLNGVFEVNEGEQVITKGAKGVYSKEDGRDLVTGQQMPVASVTKTMTAASILKLQDQGKLSVQDNVAKHFPADSGMWNDNKMPEWAEKVTIHHLLTHTSGLTEYFMGMPLNVEQTHEKINKDIINFAASQELRAAPGEKFEYVNTNFVLLGMIIEKVSGKELGVFYEEELFKPLGMKNTRLAKLDEAIKWQKGELVEKLPHRYFVTPTGDAPVMNKADAQFIMVPYADGGVISTADDIITWHKALHAGKVISKESLKLMTTKHYESDKKFGVNTHTGYGLFITELENGDVVYQHAGSALAIRCESGYVPAKNVYYAILSNVMDYVPDEMKDKVDLTNPNNQLDIFFFTQAILNAIQ